MSKLKYILFITFVFSIYGCASMVDDPFTKDLLTDPQKINLEDDDPRRMKVGYLSRYMMDSDDRANLESKIQNDSSLKKWNTVNYVLASQTLTDIAVGELGSSLGSNVGLSVFIATNVFGAIFDGSSDFISGAYIPAQIGDITIKTHQEAIEALNNLIHQRINVISEAIGWQAICQYGCDSGNQIWRMTNLSKNHLPTNYIYQPKEIVIQVNYADVVQVEKSNMISALLGEKITWQTQFINGFDIGVFEPVEFDESGLPKIFLHESNKYFLTSAYDLSKTHIGRDLLRVFHGTPYTISGTTEGHPNRVFYNTDMYTISSKIEDVVTEDNLLLNLESKKL